MSRVRLNRIVLRQRIFIYAFMMNAYAVLASNAFLRGIGVAEFKSSTVLFMAALNFIWVTLTLIIGVKLYPKCNKVLHNNMCMLFTIGSVVLTRLSISRAMRQMSFAFLAIIISFVIPAIFEKTTDLRRFTWLYGIGGVAALVFTAVLSVPEYGAKLSVGFFGISLQPSEFVKLSFVLFMSSMLYKELNKEKLLLSTFIAALHVLILVYCKDLGSAAVFAFSYMVIVYAATRSKLFLTGCTFLGALGLIASYFMFSHVRVRVAVWLHPMNDPDGKGYQLTQSLFAIGSGRWIGSGLTLGKPTKIPVVTKDYIFAAISEEFGAIFALCLLAVCVSCFLMIFEISIRAKDTFYKLTMLGFGTVYVVGSFLNIGSTIRFIPSTGVTLPLVSYGGSSLFATIMLFSIVQGLNKYGNGRKRDISEADAKKSEAFVGMSYLWLSLFVVMGGYFAYYVANDYNNYVDSEYNSRNVTSSNQVERGDIISSDGVVLAKSGHSAGADLRDYPYENMFFHSVGFTVGQKSGAERLANRYLVKSDEGILRLLKHGLNKEKAKGNTLVSTLNYEVTKACYDAMGSYDGAAIAIDPKTGKVIAMVSKPDYNPEKLSEDIADVLSGAKGDSILLNRVTAGQYTPGSVFKIVTALAYINQDPEYEKFSYNCSGLIEAGDFTIHCSGYKAHGVQSLAETFAHSCNCGYASLGEVLDVKGYQNTAFKLLFDRDISSKLLDVASSHFDLSEDDDIGMRAQTGMGQGATTVTPLNMCLIACAIANDGKIYEPYMTDKIKTAGGFPLKIWLPESAGRLMSKDEAAVMKSLMAKVVEDGTLRSIASEDYAVYGKTGSAEYSNDKNKTHSWFVGFAENEDGEQIAIAVVMEGAGTGAKYAAPCAKKMMDAYFKAD